MKKFIQITGILTLLTFALSSMAQNVITIPKENAHEADSGKVYDSSKPYPSFPGGDQARMKFLAKNIVYPVKEKEAGTQGTVFVSYIVEKDGRITHVRVLRGVTEGIDKEVVRVIKKMPNWEAGKLNGEPVRVRMNMPVKFLLPKKNTKYAEIEDDVAITDVDVAIAPEEIPDSTKKEDEIFVFVEESASFPGGQEARMKYLRENINYPKLAMESGIQGTVYLKFIVEKDGSISNIKVLRGIGGGCDKEAIRVLKSMPKWNPGRQRGKAVRTQFNIPIKFTLAGPTKKRSKKEKRRRKRQGKE